MANALSDQKIIHSLSLPIINYLVLHRHCNDLKIRAKLFFSTYKYDCVIMFASRLESGLRETDVEIRLAPLISLTILTHVPSRQHYQLTRLE